MNSNTVWSTLSRVAGAPLAFDALPSQVVAGVPLDLVFTIFPSHPSNQLIVEQRSDGRERVTVRGWPDGLDAVTGAQRFRVQMPALAPDETAHYAPTLSRAGLVVQALPIRSTRGIQAAAATAVPDTTPAHPEAVPRYQWGSEFLGAMTLQFVTESLGPCPDGMRITFHVESGEIRGPKINAKVRGGDWMLLRRDGVGVADCRITCETDDGALLLSRYSGIADLGPDAYERAQRNAFDPDPSAVLTPQFITSHPNWLWLNRLQCLAVGHANMPKLMLRVDIYAIRAGPPLPSSGLPLVDSAPPTGDVH